MLSINKITKQTPKIYRETVQNNAFQFLKSELIKERILKLPDFVLDFIITIDASQNGLGTMLSQIQNSNEVAIAYASRLTTRYEKNYLVHELKGLGIIFAPKVWRVYLLGRRFKSKTDNSALTFLQNNKKRK